MLTINENHILLHSNTKSCSLKSDGIFFELDVKEEYEYRFTGEIKYNEFEKKNAALIAFAFDNFQLDLENCNDFGLRYSEKAGAFSYLNTLYDTNTYDITIKIPVKVKKIKVRIRSWYNKKEIRIAKMIFFQVSKPKEKRVFESCKQIIFSKIKDLKIIYDEPVLYRYVGDDLPFEFLTHFKIKSKKLVVIGTAAIKQEFVLPAFNRHTQISKIPESCMIVHDPTLYLDREILIGWYQGNITSSVFLKISKLLNVFLEYLSLDNSSTLFYGGSAGGFFSLMMAGYIQESIACVTNPQTSVLAYTEGEVKKLLHHAYNDITLIEAKDKYLQSMSVMEFYKTINFFPKIWYKQNRLDFFHYKNHMLPLLEYYIRDTKNLSMHNNLILEIFSHEKGHSAVANVNEMIYEIKQSFDKFSIEE